jgi:hypothetical protein
MVATDRWLEMDLTWFNPTQGMPPQMDTLLARVAPLLQAVEGERGIFFNVGWLIDLVTEWTGNPQQKIPTRSRRTALWARQTYADLAAFIRQMKRQAEDYGIGDLQIGILFVDWANVVWPPELKIYDFESDWYGRHPELYAPAKSFIGMPDLHPINRLKADTYPYATSPKGLAANSYFPDFFGKQWSHLADFLGCDAVHLRDGFTGPMIYTRNGPYGTSAPADTKRVEQFSRVVRDLFKAVKTANPAKKVFGYSSAISPVADWRVGCVDFETLVADGYLDAWVEQTWGGAWQDWWHQLWKGWTFQMANLLTRGVMIARANQQRAAQGNVPCKFYNLIETWDGWEPWDTLHQVPHKLRWGIWAFTHAAALTPDGLKVPDGSYVSWMNNRDMELLSEEDVAYINSQLTAAQENALRMEQVYGPALVYNRAMMAWLSREHPDWNVTEWVDDQGAMLMKWGTPVMSASRAEWLPDLPTRPEALIMQTPGQLDERTQRALLGAATIVLATGRADVLDKGVLKRLGLKLAGGLIGAGFHKVNLNHLSETAGAEGTEEEFQYYDAPQGDRPYLPAHQPIEAESGAVVHYQTALTPLLTCKDGWVYWQPPDWSEPFNQFVPKYQLGSTFPHYRTALLLHELAASAGLSHLEAIEYPMTTAFHLWRSGGQVYVLLGNLETGEFGDSRNLRYVTLKLSRRQLGLGRSPCPLYRVDDADQGSVGETIAPVQSDDAWLKYTIMLLPEQCAVYVVSE